MYRLIHRNQNQQLLSQTTHKLLPFLELPTTKHSMLPMLPKLSMLPMLELATMVLKLSVTMASSVEAMSHIVTAMAAMA